MTQEFITEPYLDMQRRLHADPRGYGGRGDKWAGIVVQIALEYDATSILDYGCGQGSLIRRLRSMVGDRVRLAEYDPAIPGKDTLPEPADLVVCTDVLEHIESPCLPAVLAHIKSLTRKAVWMVISTKESNKILADGRNAHLTIQPGKWWRPKLRDAGFRLRPPPTVVRLFPDKEYALILEHAPEAT